MPETTARPASTAVRADGGAGEVRACRSAQLTVPAVAHGNRDARKVGQPAEGDDQLQRAAADAEPGQPQAAGDGEQHLRQRRDGPAGRNPVRRSCGVAAATLFSDRRLTGVVTTK